MAYTPTNWQKGDVITAEKLNKLEEMVGTLSNYDIVFTEVDDSITADGLSFEELYQKGAENISAKYISRSDDVTQVESLTGVMASEFEGARSLQLMLSEYAAMLYSNGRATINNNFYTYTYSDGHYVFTKAQ